MLLPSVVACFLTAGVQSAVLKPFPETVTVIENSTNSSGSKTQSFAAIPDGYWLNDLSGRGRAAFNADPIGYKVFRNVKEFGAKGDGMTDDSGAFNSAISSGNRCGPWVCQSSSNTPAVVYIPSGTYLIANPIIFYYMTQLIGDPRNPPVLKAAPSFQAENLIDASPYNNQNNAPGWSSTNIFLRQIRNLVIDGTAVPPTQAFQGIHWPSAQATTIQNVQIRMTQASNSVHAGIFIENGSGGHVADLIISGGLYGMKIGNQQFTMRNIQISNAVIGISQIWNWGWTYSGLQISGCNIAFSMNSTATNGSLQVGSVVILDSQISNCQKFVDMAWTRTTAPRGAGQLILENIQLSKVGAAVTNQGVTILAGGTTTIQAWGQGNEYTPSGPTQFQGSFTPLGRPESLLNGTEYYSKSKPQYENLSAADFVSARSSGATGDGNTDDTQSIQNAIYAAVLLNKVLFFEQGHYKVTQTIHVPPNTRMVGESFSVIMGSGPAFGDMNNPAPIVQIGKPGDTGNFEWSDMLVQVQGATAGAILIEYNLNTARGGGVWDVHTRVGGTKGSNLQVGQCPKFSNSPSCYAAHTNVHITEYGTGAYFENNWFWTADHDIDDLNSTQISVYTGRGLHVEASNVWLWANSVEHHALYQYQFNSANDVFAGFIQTETPYYMPNPDAKSQPYSLSDGFSDPNYALACPTGICDAYGLRVLNSEKIMIYGGGLYSFFKNYDVSCSDPNAPNGLRDCQNRIFSIEGNSSLQAFALSEVGALQMLTISGQDKASWSDNLSVYSNTIGLIQVTNTT